MTTLAGALLSLGLVAGVGGVWGGYELAMRDVTGVPVVRALEGPMRVQPEDPGGLSAEHQGLAVNAVAAEGGGAARPADTLTLAPQPAELAAEDAPADPGAAAAVAAAAMTAPEAAPEALAEASDLAVLAALETDDPVAAALALADAVAEGVEPLSEATPAPAPTEAVAVAPEAAPPTVAPPTPPEPEVQSDRIAADVPGVKRSPRPARRPPAELAIAASVSVSARADANPATAPPVAAAAETNEIDPTSLPVGTRLVQLGGAFDSPEVARSEWVKLAGRFDDYMGGKTRVIEEAKSGGKTFYRLRAHGFADLSDARRFCSA